MCSSESEFYCILCGNKGIPISRVKSKGREAGHLKKLYCLHCRKETNHAEVKEYTHYSYKDFLFEFKNGNFTKEGNRVMPYGAFRDTIHRKGVKLP